MATGVVQDDGSFQMSPVEDSYRSLSDEALYSRYENSDEQAFEELFRRYRKPLFRFVLRFLRDKHASQDAVQDVFLRIIRNPSCYRARSRFSTWLHAVARNLCIDMLRKKKYRMVSLFDRSIEDLYPSFRHRRIGRIENPDQNPEDHVAVTDLRVKLLVAICAIPDEQRVVFLLREVGEMPFSEIATMLHLSTNTTKSRMRYACLNLRKALGQLGVAGVRNIN